MAHLYALVFSRRILCRLMANGSAHVSARWVNRPCDEGTFTECRACDLEATSGIEPLYKALQASASPLCQVAVVFHLSQFKSHKIL